MKKKIVAILATIAAVFGFGFAANTAMAYGATGTVSGNVATFTFTGLTPGQRYVVSYDDTTVENVTLAATKYSNVKEAHEDGTLTATYTFKSGLLAPSHLHLRSRWGRQSDRCRSRFRFRDRRRYRRRHRQEERDRFHRCCYRSVRCGRRAAGCRWHLPGCRSQELCSLNNNQVDTHHIYVS